MKRYSSVPSSSLSSGMEKPNRISKPYSRSPAILARRALLKRIQRRELAKLQSLLPHSLHNRPRLADSNNNVVRSGRRGQDVELAIVLDAVRYIDHLTATVLARVQNGSLAVDPNILRTIQESAANRSRNDRSLVEIRNPENQRKSSSVKSI